MCNGQSIIMDTFRVATHILQTLNLNVVMLHVCIKCPVISL